MKLAVGWHVRLSVDVDVWIVDIEAGGNVVFDAFNDLAVKLIVVDWSGK